MPTISEALKIMAVIEWENFKTKQDNGDDRELYKNFIREKMRLFEVYNITTKKWKKYTDLHHIDSEIHFNPRNFYPEKYYK